MNRKKSADKKTSEVFPFSTSNISFFSQYRQFTPADDRLRESYLIHHQRSRSVIYVRESIETYSQRQLEGLMNNASSKPKNKKDEAKTETPKPPVAVDTTIPNNNNTISIEHDSNAASKTQRLSK